MKKVECLSIILNSIIGIPDISFVFLNYSPGLELHICLFNFDKGHNIVSFMTCRPICAERCALQYARTSLKGSSLPRIVSHFLLESDRPSEMMNICKKSRSKFPLFRELFRFEFSIFAIGDVMKGKFHTRVPLSTMQ